MKNPPLSDVQTFLKLVWDKCCTATDKSWSRINSSMRAAVHLSVTAGFKYTEIDFKDILVGPFNSGYWMGDSYEWFYSLAIASGNLSAAKSYEWRYNRKPYFGEEVSLGLNEQGEIVDSYSVRQKERLHVGAHFHYYGQRVAVTSFAEDQSYLIACSYISNERGKALDRRLKISREDLLTHNKERKERAKMFEDLYKLAREDEAVNKNSTLRETILKKIGCKDPVKRAAMPIEKLRKIWSYFHTMKALA